MPGESPHADMGSDARARYERLHQVFASARTLPREARPAFLDEACAGDDALREELDGLLEALEDEAAPFSDASLARGREQLERLFDEVSDPAAPRSESAWLPERVGSYRVLEKIGAGGMGVVYEAEQLNPKRRVALKLIHPGQLTRERVQRFERESRILARLSHPGIAQVYESGSFDAGLGPQPYFAMELIRGVDLRSYAEREGLDQRARVALIASVCDAVQHAHRAGIVHRDLKPDNVLVDASGRTKVLDFGVAFTASTSTLRSTMITDEGRILGTLAYMAPEQLDPSGSAVSPRSDVYALGVMAFELLAGELPIDPTGLPITAGLRLVAGQDPARAASVRRSLRGDLDAILGKALEKEPARRYESAEALAADLRRHLASEPITARPPSTVYRAHRFARRHKGLVATLVALTLGMISSAVLAAVASERRRQAESLGEELDENLYFAQMQLASGVAFEPSSSPRIREILDRWVPDEGTVDRRGFEWHLLNRMTRAGETVLERGHRVTAVRWHPERDVMIAGERDAGVFDGGAGAFVASLGNPFDVHEIAWSPDGQIVLLSGARDLAAYEFGTWRQLAHHTFETEGTGIAWHPTGTHALVIGRDGTVRRFEREGSGLALVHEDRDLFGHDGLCAFHPSGEFLVVTTERRNGARTLDPVTFATGPPLPFAADVGNNITHLAFSPSGERIAVASGKGPIEIFVTGDPASPAWTLERRLEGHAQYVSDLAWSADGARLASSCADRSVQVFDAATGRRLEQLRGHRDSVENVHWRPSDGAVTSASLDGTIRIWEAAAAPALWFEPGQEGSFTGAASCGFGPEGRWLVVDRGYGAEVRRVEQGRAPTVDTLHPSVWVEWRADGRFLAWRIDDLLVVHDQVEGREHLSHWVGPVTGYGAHIAWNPWAPDVLALGGAIHLRIVEVPAEAGGEARERKLPFDGGIVRDVDWLPGGDRLLVASTDGRRGMFHLVHCGESDRIERVQDFDGRDPLDVDLSPDGRFLAVAFDDDIVDVLSVSDWSRRFRLIGHTNRVRRVAYAPDGTRLATAGGDRTLRLWDAERGHLAATFALDTPVRTLAWGPDGDRLVAVGDDTSIRLFNAGSEAP